MQVGKNLGINKTGLITNETGYARELTSQKQIKGHHE